MSDNLVYVFKKFDYKSYTSDLYGNLTQLKIHYERKDKKNFVAFTIPLTKQQFKSSEFRMKIENEIANLSITECVKKLLIKFPDYTEDILRQIPQDIFSNKEKMLEVFGTIANNKNQIKIAKYVIKERKTKKKPLGERNNFYAMLNEYTNSTF
jgi:hypothetical protein